MYESFSDRLRRLSQRLAALLVHKGAHAAWLVIFLLLFAISVAINPAKFAAMNWIATKIIGAALLGVGLWATFGRQRLRPDQDMLEGIEESMDLTRKVMLIVGAMVTAAFVS